MMGLRLVAKKGLDAYDIMDTKPLEKEALNQVSSLLIRYGFKCADLSFDEDGIDILVIKKLDHESVFWKGVRCQSKGRDVSKSSSSVVIPQDYVREDFLVFVYVKPADVDNSKTYLFTAEDIWNKWKRKNGKFVLYISQKFCNNTENEKYRFNESRSTLVEKLLSNSDKTLEDVDVKALSEADFYFRMWQKTGGLPAVEFLRDIFSDVNISFLKDTEVFVFLLCASVVVNCNIYDMSLSVDWAFEYIKTLTLCREENDNKNLVTGKIYHSDVAITYSRTWVQELLSEDGEVMGFHLHMADDEDAIDAQVMRSIYT